MMKFKDKSLSVKLYLSITVLIIIPLLVAGILLNKTFSQFALNKASENALQTLRQTQYNFDSLITDTNDISIRILSNELVQKFIQGKYTNNTEYEKMYIDIVNWIDDAIGAKEYYDSLTLYSDKEVVLGKSWHQPVDQEIIERARNLKGKGFWVTTPGEISYYRAIMDLNKLGRMIGLEKFEIREQTLYQFYKNINSFSNSNIFLLDSIGLVLSSNDKNRVGKHVGDQDFISKALQMKDGYFIDNIEDEKNIVLVYSLEDPNWSVVQTIPVKSLALPYTTINTILIFFIMLCILFGFLFSFIQQRYMINPLQTLQKEMEKLKIGNFNIDLNYDSKDEIGEVSSGFVQMAKELSQMIDEVYLTKINQREAELKALESQINPHFLYNTLDSIRWLAVKHKNYDVSEQIEALAEIFKHVLNKGESHMTISQEIDFIENYMFIQKRKYGKRIQYHINVDHDLMDYKTPKLVLQPLVENALIHGLDQVVEGGMIEIEINRAEKGIQFIVADNGIGTDGDEIQRIISSDEDSTEAFALKNIDERIKVSYGKEYGLCFTSQKGVGTKVKVLIPYIK